jgi:opine dehydrogenase
MASIRFINVLEDKHIEVEPKFAEANTLTYGTRVDFENARVDLSLNDKLITCYMLSHNFRIVFNI